MSSTTVNNKPKEEITIFCLVFNYTFKDGRTEKSSPKYCGNSPEHCYEAISKLLGACKSVLPESVRKVSFSIEGYRNSTYSNSGRADLVIADVVALCLRNPDKSDGQK